ncbi:cupin domain-containing protein [Photobacterium sp. TY1-4]|uniref:cupin domain-containing protein n=1 Tax=Photobacterium sp. TY1-4 TaxID=2899122 RepID=UPI0021BF861A|nr:cupin domain-containing protein [Photobacterium sp. TY1-4]UXH99973.1 cupin domain-containing protein [Photobacterium sp. TY1-4]
MAEYTRFFVVRSLEAVIVIHESVNKNRQWAKTPYVGVEFSWLSEDSESGRSALLKFEKGAKLPLHYHPGWEQIYVLEGVLKVNGALYYAHDFVFVDAETRHELEAIEPSQYITIAEKAGVAVVDH